MGRKNHVELASGFALLPAPKEEVKLFVSTGEEAQSVTRIENESGQLKRLLH